MIPNLSKTCYTITGYNNSEVVPISSLLPSLGKETQDLQISQANYEIENDGLLKGSREKMDFGSDHREHSPAMTGIVIYVLTFSKTCETSPSCRCHYDVFVQRF